MTRNEFAEKYQKCLPVVSQTQFDRDLLELYREAYALGAGQVGFVSEPMGMIVEGEL